MKTCWLRLYTEVLYDPKVQSLPPELFKVWINLLCVAKEHDKGGELPELEHISFLIRQNSKKTQKILEKFREISLLDGNKIHGWESRQYEGDKDGSHADRQKKYRERKKAETVNSDAPSDVTQYVTETPLRDQRSENRYQNTEIREREDIDMGHFAPSATDPVQDFEEYEQESRPRKSGIPNGNLVATNGIPAGQFQTRPGTVPDLSRIGSRPVRFKKPTVEEVQAYCEERGNSVDPTRFLDFYESNGWRVGKNPMKSWQAAVRTWERNGGRTEGQVQKRAPPPEPVRTEAERAFNRRFHFWGADWMVKQADEEGQLDGFKGVEDVCS